MSKIYLEKIKKLFEKEKIKSLQFLQGLKCYDITPNSENKNYKKRPYVIYKGKKNGKQVVIKILVRENYKNFYLRELFVYKYFPYIINNTKNFLPKLLEYGENPYFMIIKFYHDFSPLGKSYILTEKISQNELTNIIEAIESFHLPKDYVEKIIALNGLKSPLSVLETFSLYFARYKRETKFTLIKMLGKTQTEELEKKFLKTRKIFNQQKKYLSWGDCNPSNILIKRKDKNLYFKFIDFEKVDYAPAFRDWTTLFYSIYLANESLANFLRNYLSKKYPEKEFWILFYFKLLIYSYPRQWYNFAEKNEVLKQKFLHLAKITLPKYLSLI